MSDNSFNLSPIRHTPPNVVTNQPRNHLALNHLRSGNFVIPPRCPHVSNPNRRSTESTTSTLTPLRSRPIFSYSTPPQQNSRPLLRSILSPIPTNQSDLNARIISPSPNNPSSPVLSPPNSLPLTTCPYSTPYLFETYGFSPHSQSEPVNLLSTTFDPDPYTESQGIVNLTRNSLLSPTVKEYELNRLANPNLKLEFATSIYFSDLFTHPTSLTNPKIVFGSHPPPFYCTNFNFTFNHSTQAAHGSITFFNPCSKLSYSTSF